MKRIRQNCGWRQGLTQAGAWAVVGLLLAGRVGAAAAEPSVSPEALATSIHVLQTGDAVDCLREASRLSSFGAPALPALFYALTNSDTLVRDTAWRAIERAGIPADAHVTEVLLNRLGDVNDPKDLRRALELVKPVLERLYAADATNDSIRLQLAATCLELVRTRSGPKETYLLEHATELLGTLYREKGRYAEYAGYQLAMAEETLGRRYFRTDKQKAGQAYEAARAIWADFMAGASTNRMCQQRYLVLSAKVADCCWYTDRRVEAVSIYHAVESVLATMTNRDDLWWEPAALLVAAYDTRSSQYMANADYPAAEELLAKARAWVDWRIASRPDDRFGIPLVFALGLRSADLYVLKDRLDRVEPFLAKSEAVLLTPGAKTLFDTDERTKMFELLRRFRTVLARLDTSRSWREQDPGVVALAFHALGEIALESGRLTIAYAYSRDAMLLGLGAAPNAERRDRGDRLVETENMALISEAMEKPLEAMTLASNVLDQANVLLTMSARLDRDALLGRACALSMLARLNASAGEAALAQQYQTELLAAVSESKQYGIQGDEQANVFRQSYPTPVWQEPWSTPSSSVDADRRNHTALAHWEDGWWMQAASPR